MAISWHEMTALALGRAIEDGTIDSRELADYFLSRIGDVDPAHTIYLRTTAERARAEAAAAHKRAGAGLRLSPLDGVPISWKDLFDTAGDVTSHGSPVLAERVPNDDALVVERATRAGLACLGKTNQTEYAFSILGINPHYGTPANPFDETTPRLPGGSTSGGAVSVARGLAAAAIGSDTGGSVRVPSAWNGLVGLKTSFGRIPVEGVLSLSTTLDTVGPLTRDVADAAAVFAVLDGRSGPGTKAWPDLAGANTGAITLARPTGMVWDNLGSDVAKVTEAALDKLAKADVAINSVDVPEFGEVDKLISHFGPYHAAECHAVWGEAIEAKPNLVYGPILERIRLGGKMTASNVERTKHGLKTAANALHGRIREAGVLVMPTVPVGPAPIAELENDIDAWTAANAVVLRNTRLANFLGCCALTLPCGLDTNGIPVGIMLMAPSGDDERLLRIGAAIEEILAS